MDRIPVVSSDLASVGYDPATCTLEVQFARGGIYQYAGVPVDVYDGLMAAVSKGAYFNRYVKKAGYRCSKVD